MLRSPFRRCITITIAISCAVLLFNEFLIYYAQLALCNWPELPDGASSTGIVRAMILADVHMLGPRHGHWADRLRREWQMHRTFQTSLQLHRPDVVFMLGDLFDEGQSVSETQFDAYVARYRRLFAVPDGVRVVGALGNHDIGFHYRMRSDRMQRFVRRAATGGPAPVFANAPDALVRLGEVNFVVVNAMTMERDSCRLCRSAEARLERIGRLLNCSRLPANERQTSACRTVAADAEYSAPVLMLHFPTWRPTDAGHCAEHSDDGDPAERYRERWDVLSENATRWLGEVLGEPRAVFSGHSHRYCRTRTAWDADEWTVNSFSWRNGNAPVFLLAVFSGRAHAVAVCSMPLESTVLWLYKMTGVCLLGMWLLRYMPVGARALSVRIVR